MRRLTNTVPTFTAWLHMNDTWKTAGMLAESFGGKGKVDGRKNNVRKWL